MFALGILVGVAPANCFNSYEQTYAEKSSGTNQKNLAVSSKN